MVASTLWGRLAALALLVLTFTSQLHGFLIGTGIADVTGPAGEIIMMGYANLGQDTRGIHTRLFSRSYIFVDEVTQKRVVFSSVDVAFVTQNIKRKVMSMLEGKYGKTYTKHNVALSGTHTHSGPGGFADYVLFQVTSLGYVEENFDAIVQGIFESIVAAHDNLQPGRGFLNAGDLYGANINRSPYAYEQNPAEERARYGADTDVLMTLLKLVGSDGRDLGLINWFAVHPVSMNNTNHLISSDHKGAASLLFESLKNGEETAPGQGPFVAAFASSNLGDVSPATKGAFCNGGRRPGLKCDYQTSTCPNWLGNPSSKLCHGQGPSGKDSKLNTKALASMQFEAALDLFNSASTPLQGAIDYRHAFVDMPNLRVKVNGQEVKLCKPAMGYSFAAGTTDGPGVFLFQQGELTGNPYWDAVRDFIFRPTDEILACHAPKPVFLPTGETNFPHEWQAHIVDIQILRIGNLVILVAPGEFTTMAGRRLREAVKKIFVDAGVLGEDSHVVIAGLSNTYADYITTFEEYQVQRYEGASTIYGPNTLAGFIQEYSRLALAMVQNATVPEGPTPPDFTGRQLSFVRPPGVDTLPEGAKFGGVILDASSEYQAGDAIEVSFWAGNPRHDIKLGTSFMFVEREINGTWHTVRTDGNWDTEFVWEVVSERREPLQSVAHLKWFSETSALPGKYRIRYEGHAKTGETEVIPISGTSSVFTLRSSLHAKPETLSRLNDVIKQAEMNNHHMKM